MIMIMIMIMIMMIIIIINNAQKTPSLETQG